MGKDMGFAPERKARIEVKNETVNREADKTDLVRGLFRKYAPESRNGIREEKRRFKGYSDIDSFEAVERCVLANKAVSKIADSLAKVNGQLKDLPETSHCTECKITFFNPAHLKYHLQFISHDKSPGTTDTIADFESSDPSTGMLFCPWCPLLLQGPLVLTQHMKTCREKKNHSGAMLSEISDEFSCSDCRKTFGSEDDLWRHVYVTHGRPYQCSKCPENFNSKKKFQTHIVTCTGEGDPKCKDCHETFARPRGLLRHVILNPHCKLVEPYLCGKCQMSFSNRKLMLTHLWKHVRIGRFPQVGNSTSLAKIGAPVESELFDPFKVPDFFRPRVPLKPPDPVEPLKSQPESVKEPEREPFKSPESLRPSELDETVDALETSDLFEHTDPFEPYSGFDDEPQHDSEEESSAKDSEDPLKAPKGVAKGKKMLSFILDHPYSLPSSATHKSKGNLKKVSSGKTSSPNKKSESKLSGSKKKGESSTKKEEGKKKKTDSNPKKKKSPSKGEAKFAESKLETSSGNKPKKKSKPRRKNEEPMEVPATSTAETVAERSALPQGDSVSWEDDVGVMPLIQSVTSINDWNAFPDASEPSLIKKRKKKKKKKNAVIDESLMNYLKESGHDPSAYEFVFFSDSDEKETDAENAVAGPIESVLTEHPISVEAPDPNLIEFPDGRSILLEDPLPVEDQMLVDDPLPVDDALPLVDLAAGSDPLTLPAVVPKEEMVAAPSDQVLPSYEDVPMLMPLDSHLTDLCLINPWDANFVDNSLQIQKLRTEKKVETGLPPLVRLQQQSKKSPNSNVTLLDPNMKLFGLQKKISRKKKSLSEKSPAYVMLGDAVNTANHWIPLANFPAKKIPPLRPLSRKGNDTEFSVCTDGMSHPDSGLLSLALAAEAVSRREDEVTVTKVPLDAKADEKKEVKSVSQVVPSTEPRMTVTRLLLPVPKSNLTYVIDEGFQRTGVSSSMVVEIPQGNTIYSSPMILGMNPGSTCFVVTEETKRVGPVLESFLDSEMQPKGGILLPWDLETEILARTATSTLKRKTTADADSSPKSFVIKQAAGSNQEATSGKNVDESTTSQGSGETRQLLSNIPDPPKTYELPEAVSEKLVEANDNSAFQDKITETSPNKEEKETTSVRIDSDEDFQFPASPSYSFVDDGEDYSPMNILDDGSDYSPVNAHSDSFRNSAASSPERDRSPESVRYPEKFVLQEVKVLLTRLKEDELKRQESSEVILRNAGDYTCNDCGRSFKSELGWKIHRARGSKGCSYMVTSYLTKNGSMPKSLSESPKKSLAVDQRKLIQAELSDLSSSLNDMLPDDTREDSYNLAREVRWKPDENGKPNLTCECCNRTFKFSLALNVHQSKMLVKKAAKRGVASLKEEALKKDTVEVTGVEKESDLTEGFDMTALLDSQSQSSETNLEAVNKLIQLLDEDLDSSSKNSRGEDSQQKKTNETETLAPEAVEEDMTTPEIFGETAKFTKRRKQRLEKLCKVTPAPPQVLDSLENAPIPSSDDDVLIDVSKVIEMAAASLAKSSAVGLEEETVATAEKEEAPELNPTVAASLAKSSAVGTKEETVATAEREEALESNLSGATSLAQSSAAGIEEEAEATAEKEDAPESNPSGATSLAQFSAAEIGEEAVATAEKEEALESNLSNAASLAASLAQSSAAGIGEKAMATAEKEETPESKPSVAASLVQSSAAGIEEEAGATAEKEEAPETNPSVAASLAQSSEARFGDEAMATAEKEKTPESNPSVAASLAQSSEAGIGEEAVATAEKEESPESNPSVAASLAQSSAAGIVEEAVATAEKQEAPESNPSVAASLAQSSAAAIGEEAVATAEKEEAPESNPSVAASLAQSSAAAIGEEAVATAEKEGSPESNPSVAATLAASLSQSSAAGIVEEAVATAEKEEAPESNPSVAASLAQSSAAAIGEEAVATAEKEGSPESNPSVAATLAASLAQSSAAEFGKEAGATAEKEKALDSNPSGEPPVYVCSYCCRKFSNQTNLKIHLTCEKKREIRKRALQKSTTKVGLDGSTASSDVRPATMSESGPEGFVESPGRSKSQRKSSNEASLKILASAKKRRGCRSGDVGVNALNPVPEPAADSKLVVLESDVDSTAVPEFGVESKILAAESSLVSESAVELSLVVPESAQSKLIVSATAVDSELVPESVVEPKLDLESAVKPKLVVPISAVEPNVVVPESTLQPNFVVPESVVETKLIFPESPVVESLVQQYAAEPGIVIADSVVEAKLAVPESAVDPKPVDIESAEDANTIVSESAVEPKLVISESAVEPKLVISESAVEPKLVVPESAVEPTLVVPKSAVELSCVVPESSELLESLLCLDSNDKESVDSEQFFNEISKKILLAVETDIQSRLPQKGDIKEHNTSEVPEVTPPESTTVPNVPAGVNSETRIPSEKEPVLQTESCENVTQKTTPQKESGTPRKTLSPGKPKAEAFKISRSGRRIKKKNRFGVDDSFGLIPKSSNLGTFDKTPLKVEAVANISQDTTRNAAPTSAEKPADELAKTYQCSSCWEWFPSKQKLGDHRRRYCQQGSARFLLRKKMRQNECPRCKMFSKTLNSLNVHMKFCQAACREGLLDMPNKVEEAAGKTRDVLANWKAGELAQKDTKSLHRPKFSCKVCGRVFQSLQALRTHKWQRLKTGNFNKTFCVPIGLKSGRGDANKNQDLVQTDSNVTPNPSGDLIPRRRRRRRSNKKLMSKKARRALREASLLTTPRFTSDKQAGAENDTSDVPTISSSALDEENVSSDAPVSAGPVMKGKEVKCKNCERIFQSRRALYGHLGCSKHSSNPVCVRKTENEKSVDQNESPVDREVAADKSSGQRETRGVHSCSDCYRVFSSAKGLRQHCFIFHFLSDPKERTCESCGREFNTTAALGLHRYHVSKSEGKCLPASKTSSGSAETEKCARVSDVSAEAEKSADVPGESASGDASVECSFESAKDVSLAEISFESVPAKKIRGEVPAEASAESGSREVSSSVKADPSVSQSPAEAEAVCQLCHRSFRSVRSLRMHMNHRKRRGFCGLDTSVALLEEDTSASTSLLLENDDTNDSTVARSLPLDETSLDFDSSSQPSLPPNDSLLSADNSESSSLHTSDGDPKSESRRSRSSKGKKSIVLKSLYQCDLCLTNYSYLKSLFRHVEISHGTADMKCEDCGMSFNSVQGLQIHIMTKETKLFKSAYEPVKLNELAELQESSTFRETTKLEAAPKENILTPAAEAPAAKPVKRKRKKSDDQKAAAEETSLTHAESDEHKESSKDHNAPAEEDRSTAVEAASTKPSKRKKKLEDQRALEEYARMIPTVEVPLTPSKRRKRTVSLDQNTSGIEISSTPAVETTTKSKRRRKINKSVDQSSPGERLFQSEKRKKENKSAVPKEKTSLTPTHSDEAKENPGDTNAEEATLTLAVDVYEDGSSTTVEDIPANCKAGKLEYLGNLSSSEHSVMSPKRRRGAKAATSETEVPESPRLLRSSAKSTPVEEPKFSAPSSPNRTRTVTFILSFENKNVRFVSLKCYPRQPPNPIVHCSKCKQCMKKEQIKDHECDSNHFICMCQKCRLHFPYDQYTLMVSNCKRRLNSAPETPEPEAMNTVSTDMPVTNPTLKYSTNVLTDSNKIKQCALCGEVMYSFSKLEKHLMLVHTKLLTCLKCGTCFSETKAWETHVQLDTCMSRSSDCGQDRPECTTKAEKKDPQQSCDSCYKLFESVEKLEEHSCSLGTAFPWKLFRCNSCNGWFQNELLLRTHKADNCDTK